MRAFRTKGVVGAALGLAFLELLLSNCGSRFYRCGGAPLSCAERTAEHCQSGADTQCQPGPACEPPVCSAIKLGTKCSDQPLCAFDSSFACSPLPDEPCTGSATQAECEKADATCLWRTVCHGNAGTCAPYHGAACTAVPGCVWFQDEED